MTVAASREPRITRKVLAMLSPSMLQCATQGLRPCRRAATTTLAMRQLPAALAAQRDLVSCGILSARTARTPLSAERLAGQRISDAGEPWGPGAAFGGGRAGRRPGFSGLARAAVQQKQQQQQTARTPQLPAKPPVSARDVVIAVDDTDDAQQAVEWAAGNVLKGGGRCLLLPSPSPNAHTLTCSCCCRAMSGCNLSYHLRTQVLAQHARP